MSKFKKDDLLECVTLRGCGCITTLNGFIVGESYKVINRNGKLCVKGDGDSTCRIDMWSSCFKLAERNPMPELEAGMLVDQDGLDGTVGDSYIYIDDDLMITLDGNDWNRNTCKSRISAIYEKRNASLKSSRITKGDPIWQRSDNSAELEQLAELKKTISDASDTIADAQKQASILEDALNGRR